LVDILSLLGLPLKQHAIYFWLEKKARSQARLSLLAAGLLFLLGLVVLSITFGVIYLVIGCAFDWAIPHSPSTRLIVSLIVLGLLFVGNATTDRAYLESLSFSTGTKEEKPVSIYVPTVGMASTINPLAPDSAHSIVKVITTLLYTGPRLVTGSMRMCGKGRRLARMDLAGQAAVLELLYRKDKRVPFEEIAAAVPPGHYVGAIVQQLRELDAVLFLKSPPPGLALTSDFRQEMSGLEPESPEPEKVKPKKTERKRKRRQH
jgi:hypothetical protein